MSTGPADDFDARGGWPGVLRLLAANENLAPDHARLALGRVLDGSASDAQTAALVFGLKVKGETVGEVAGFVDAMLAAAAPLDLADPAGTLDIVGTGGSNALAGRAFNVSTMASIVAAGAGAVVCKHGNRKASSTSGSTDLLEELGVVVELDGPAVEQCVNETGLGFAFARVFHPAMRFAAAVRAELGVPTIFNVLGPLSHPGRVGRQLIGVSDPSLVPLIAEVSRARGIRRAWIVNGDSALDELTTTGPNTVWDVADGRIRQFDLDATDLGLARARLEELGVGGPAANAAAARDILAGGTGPLRDMVVLNAAAGLVVAGVTDDLDRGIAAAQQSIDSGDARGVLERLVAVSRAAVGDHGGAG